MSSKAIKRVLAGQRDDLWVAGSTIVFELACVPALAPRKIGDEGININKIKISFLYMISLRLLFFTLTENWKK